MKSLVASSCNNSCGCGQEQWFSSLLYATCRRPSGNSSRGREMTAALQGPVRSFFRRVSKAACPFPFWHVSCHVISCVWTPSKLRMARIEIGWENILCYSIWKYVILVTSRCGLCGTTVVLAGGNHSRSAAWQMCWGRRTGTSGQGLGNMQYLLMAVRGAAATFWLMQYNAHPTVAFLECFHSMFIRTAVLLPHANKNSGGAI